jgi:hypothetical protein
LLNTSEPKWENIISDKKEIEKDNNNLEEM